MTILVTRPPPKAEALARRLRATGLDALAAPVSRIVPLDEPPPVGPVQAAMATSANALTGTVPAAVLARPIHCVGARTAEAARARGFPDVIEAAGAATDLAEQVAARCAPDAGPLLYLAGQPRKPVLEQRLAEAGFDVTIWLRYRAEAVDALPAPAIAALRAAPATILFYSDRAVQLFCGLAEAAGIDVSRLDALCFTPAIAQTARPCFARVDSWHGAGEEALLSRLRHGLACADRSDAMMRTGIGSTGGRP